MSLDIFQTSLELEKDSVFGSSIFENSGTPKIQISQRDSEEEDWYRQVFFEYIYIFLYPLLQLHRI